MSTAARRSSTWPSIAGCARGSSRWRTRNRPASWWWTPHARPRKWRPPSTPRPTASSPAVNRNPLRCAPIHDSGGRAASAPLLVHGGRGGPGCAAPDRRWRARRSRGPVRPIQDDGLLDRLPHHERFLARRGRRPGRLPRGVAQRRPLRGGSRERENLVAVHRPPPGDRRDPPATSDDRAARRRDAATRGIDAARRVGRSRRRAGRRAGALSARCAVRRPARGARARLLRWAHAARDRRADGDAAGDGQEPNAVGAAGDAPVARGEVDMSAPNVIPELTCDEVRELAGAFVLGALDAAEAAAVRAHLAAAGHADAHPEIAELGAVVPALAEIVPI